MSISALQSLELIERLHAYDSVSAPTVEEEHARWVGTALSIAGQPLLVECGALQEIVETPDVTSIPGTKPWVLGVAAFKGGLLPIFSGDVFFRKRPYTGRVRDYCMVIERAGMHFGLTLSGVQRDLQFLPEDRSMDHTIDPDFEHFTVGGFTYEGEFMPVLDLDKLVADEDLSNASAAKISISRGKNDG